MLDLWREQAGKHSPSALQPRGQREVISGSGPTRRDYDAPPRGVYRAVRTRGAGRSQMVSVADRTFKPGPELCGLPRGLAVVVGDLKRDCHFADALFPSLLIHLLKVEGGAAE